ncbi:tRNA pseudouridine(38-40) synthase TruA [Pseudoxanthomonas winnipegensis]|jgi:tRNA pseudouridine38-40 synthase|uniref:tRNA pseudouridine synthase A n=1 Tax=Pseudoxanthomonas winnipegensis TaxID=2480810 RepID=A0ABY1WCB7_9GAMM|nr:tRNA pseudouridine(38-40) synthase TruA [Pseudoxanthomonas winnipegensis]TAA11195.1 tRNA pseudouridine(38-40) synthase TruA [Pseudoxanthomonas winnipegensis]TAA18620.1 tRNA pseudouridine(38-40) synthase TruA [Pseudoxanthomonas winnipegensis]TAH74004.1 tRNA pseudouridine(38-40) synthase TruA [Pseudoxanthomonas winnipegensis]
MRYALGVEYDGGDFQGWQRLEKPGAPVHTPSVQSTLEAALAAVANAPIDTVCAGRTDAGVHGQCQVVHFDTEVARTPRGWTLGATANLPPSICVRWCVPVAEDFHARFSARARRYRYVLLNRAVRPALGRQLLSWERLPLDAAAMHRAAQALLGENDFSAFRTVHCQARHPMRELQSIAVTRQGEQVIVEVQANAFLHHMVRNIVGSLLLVGRGEQPEGWIAELLAGRDRTLAGPTAPPQGLVFVGPLYPAGWGLPDEVTLREA